MIGLAIITLILLGIWAIMMLNLPEKMNLHSKSGHKYVALLGALLLLMGATIAWMNKADDVVMGEKEAVGKYLVQNEFAGKIYQDSDGRYFILEKTWVDLVHPEKRVYLDPVAAAEYVKLSNQINESYIKSLIIGSTP